MVFLDLPDIEMLYSNPMAQFEREQPALGPTALQIIEDVPTVLQISNSTIYIILNNLK